MPDCTYCHKAIILYKEPKMMFTVLGGKFYHSRCYIEIHKMGDVRAFE